MSGAEAGGNRWRCRGVCAGMGSVAAFVLRSLLVCGSADAQCIGWTEGSDYVQSGSITAIAAGDFTGDGRVDLALGVPTGSGTVLRIMRSEGFGNFSTMVEYPSSGSINSLASADFDGDGLSDLAIGLPTGNGPVLRVMRSVGGGFTTIGEYPVSGTVSAIAAGDFDGDQRPDLMIGTFSGGAPVIRFMRNEGGGAFASAGEPVRDLYAYALAAGDFNGDGRMDVAMGTVVGYSSVVRMLLGQGNGGFSWAGDTSINGGIQSLAAGDFDADGKVDLVAGVSSSGSNLRTYQGQGNGGLYWIGDTPQGGTVLALAAADLNGDRRPEPAMSTYVYGRGAVLRIKFNIGGVGVYSPGDVRVCRDAVGELTATGVGPGVLEYRWQLENPAAAGDWIDIEDGPITIAGVVWGAAANSGQGTLQLQPDPMTYQVAGDVRFRCVVSNYCGSVTSASALLTVCACLVCPADFNQDGGIDGTDVSAFFDRWEVGHCDADVNGDGGVDGADVDRFFAAWEGGGC
ncbi:MAG: VCBS repeat-containing protein [Planctomycetes bacterium]|nr:VCBS repeat-containing protein [Planctomycetota bacterium]